MGVEGAIGCAGRRARGAADVWAAGASAGNLNPSPRSAQCSHCSPSASQRAGLRPLPPPTAPEWRPRLLHPLMLLCPGPRRHAVHCALPSINEHHLHSSAPRRRPPRSPGEEEQCGPSARHVQLPRIDSAPPTSPASSRPVHAGSSAQDKERASSHVAHRCPMRHFVRRRRRAQPCASVHAHRPPRLFITR